MGKLNSIRKKVTYRKRKIGDIKKNNTRKFIMSLISECIDRIDHIKAESDSDSDISLPTLDEKPIINVSIPSTSNFAAMSNSEVVDFPPVCNKFRYLCNFQKSMEW